MLRTPAPFIGALGVIEDMSRNVYLGLTIVFAASVATSWLIPVSELVKGMIALPGVGALFGALFQIARDSSEFERKLHLQSDQQIFTLGASSHMSAIAFDKHVQFCEAYMSEVHDTVSILFREGPTVTAMECARKLHDLKREYAAWIPKPVALQLEPFEDALHKLGVKQQLGNALERDQREDRLTALREANAIFCNILGLDKMRGTDPDQKPEIAIENIKEAIRQILGVDQIVEVRNFIVSRSVKYVRDNT